MNLFNGAYSGSVSTSSRVPAMPTSPHKRTLYIVLADHFILHTPVISTPPLPATLCLLYLYTHIYIYLSLSSPTLPIASRMNPHRRLCSLIRNTPPASAPHFLKVTSNSSQKRSEKGHAPPDLCLLLSNSTPCWCGCDVNFAP